MRIVEGEGILNGISNEFLSSIMEGTTHCNDPPMSRVDRAGSCNLKRLVLENIPFASMENIVRIFRRHDWPLEELVLMNVAYKDPRYLLPWDILLIFMLTFKGYARD